MNITIHRIPTGKWRQNCYLVYPEHKSGLIIIDPGSDHDLIIEYINTHSLKPLAIINTHAHFDHVGAVNMLQNLYGIPFYLHASDFQLLKQANLYKMVFGEVVSIAIPQPTYDFSSLESSVKLGDISVSVIFTPGHTAGSVCFLIEGNLFSGDTFLSSGLGRTDLPGGNYSDIVLSISSLSKNLPENFIVWPGHGREFLCSTNELLNILPSDSRKL